MLPASVIVPADMLIKVLLLALPLDIWQSPVIVDDELMAALIDKAGPTPAEPPVAIAGVPLRVRSPVPVQETALPLPFNSNAGAVEIPVTLNAPVPDSTMVVPLPVIETLPVIVSVCPVPTVSIPDVDVLV